MSVYFKEETNLKKNSNSLLINIFHQFLKFKLLASVTVLCNYSCALKTACLTFLNASDLQISHIKSPSKQKKKRLKEPQKEVKEQPKNQCCAF